MEVKPIEATPQLSEADSKKIIKEVSTKPNYKRVQKLEQIINMNKEIELPTVGEILKEEFLEPCGLSVYSLAKDINVPVSRIQSILNGNRKITIDTSIRLGKYFGVSDEYFLNIQNSIDRER